MAILLAAVTPAAGGEGDRWTRFGREVHDLPQREMAGHELSLARPPNARDADSLPRGAPRP